MGLLANALCLNFLLSALACLIPFFFRAVGWLEHCLVVLPILLRHAVSIFRSLNWGTLLYYSPSLWAFSYYSSRIQVAWGKREVEVMIAAEEKEVQFGLCWILEEQYELKDWR